jgi:hypothetical protein
MDKYKEIKQWNRNITTIRSTLPMVR